MAKTTTTALHNDSGVFQSASTDPQQQQHHYAQPSYSAHSPLTLRSDIIFDREHIDLSISTALTRPVNLKTNATRKRTPVRRTLPPRTRSMTKANSNSSLTQNSPSTSPSSSSTSRSITSLIKPIITVTAPERTREVVSTRSTTSASSAIIVTTATSPTTTIPTSQNIGRVRQAVNRLEEKMLLNRQVQSSSPSNSSRSLILGEKRRSHDMDDNDHVFKFPRTQFHEGLPKRHTQPAVALSDGQLDVKTFSFRFPAGLDPTFPLRFVGQFLVPSQTVQPATTTSSAGSQALGHSNSPRACSASRGVANGTNATGQDIEQDTEAETIKNIAETLLRHLPTAHHTPPPPPSTLESLMSDSSTQNLRQVPLTTRSGSDATHLSLPAINLPLPTESVRPAGNRSMHARSIPERVRLNLTYHLEQQDPNNRHAVLDAIDMEPLPPSDRRSSSAPASSAAPRYSTRNRQSRSPRE
ncbi:hypothetical protein BGZ47_004943 [Haplosporangium gracile]|nr:hypothetical protein BGZ47_004943 [Haplosporangium gracile]